MPRTLRGWPWRSPRTILLGALVLPICAPGCFPHVLPPPEVHYPAPPPLACVPMPESSCAAPTPPDGAAAPGEGEVLPIDLPTALRLADSQNPEIAVARERIREAFAQQQRAEVFWLPDLSVGPEWTRHDGQIQRFNGQVVTSSRSAVFGGGVASLNFDLAEGVFNELAARQVTEARRAGARATANERLLEVAISYVDLVQTYAELVVNEETLKNAREMYSILDNYVKTGKGALADRARAEVEVRARERERLEIQGRIGVAAARLARLLLLQSDTLLRPVDPALVPLPLVPEEAPLDLLVKQALENRPELAENRALALAAWERWRAAKISPWIPNLSIAYGSGLYGGGPNSFVGNFSGREDVVAGAFWRLENFGLGNAARIAESRSVYNQATLRQDSVQAEVANQVVAAFRVAFVRRRETEVTEKGVVAARESYRLNLDRLRRAPEQGRPIELLQAIQALAKAQQEAVQVIADYNRAQLRLYTALGNPPLCALQQARGPSSALPASPEQKPD